MKILTMIIACKSANQLPKHYDFFHRSISVGLESHLNLTEVAFERWHATQEVPYFIHFPEKNSILKSLEAMAENKPLSSQQLPVGHLQIG